MVAYNPVIMKIKKVVVFVTEVVCDSVQFLEPKMRNKMVANVNKMNSKITVKDSVVNNQDKTIRTIIHQTRNMIIHLQMQTDRLISVMMTYHSNKINEIKAKNYQRRHTIMAGGPRRGGRRRKKYAISQQMVLHISTTKTLNY